MSAQERIRRLPHPGRLPRNPAAISNTRAGPILASRLGYRITETLRPGFLRSDLQQSGLRPPRGNAPARDSRIWTSSSRGSTISSTPRRTRARLYFEDGTVELACPPLKALLHIMAEGHWEGKKMRRSRRPGPLHPRIPLQQRLVPAAPRGPAGVRSRTGRRICPPARGLPEEPHLPGIDRKDGNRCSC